MFLYVNIFQYSSDTSITLLYEPVLSFLFQFEHTTDDGPHVLEELRYSTIISIYTATGSERSTFVMDKCIYVNKND